MTINQMGGRGQQSPTWLVFLAIAILALSILTSCTVAIGGSHQPLTLQEWQHRSAALAE